jgi:murein L,D-transpeptidase YcbB/YkuD
VTLRSAWLLAFVGVVLRPESAPVIAEPPRWVTSDGLTRDGRRLLAVLADAGAQGLEPSDYAVPDLEALVASVRERRVDPADVEARFTATLARYAADRSLGRVRAADAARTWRQEPRDVTLTLERLLAEGRFPEGLSELDPPYAEFRALREAYGHLVAHDPWVDVPPGATLHPGDLAPVARVRALADRLAAEDAAASVAIVETEDGAVYDGALVRAVTRFQTRRGLDPDGVVGPRTIDELDRDPAELAGVVAHALDRWRWMPHTPPAREIRVNVAAFDLALLEDGGEIDRMRVVVGRPDWRTPPFLDEVQGVTLNPDWHVPSSIVVRELVPEARDDPSAVSSYQITALVDGHEEPVDPEVVDWESIDPASLRARVPGGVENPLGRVKVLLGNERGVYLHDTSSPELFSRPVRTFSHGCVRVEDAMGLAAFVTGWTRDALGLAAATGGIRTLAPAAPVAVTVGYWTAGVDARGELWFAPDVYGYDARMDRLRRALRP